jgi:hypothetical protein
MKRLIAACLLFAAAGCSSRPCVDGERTSSSGYWGMGTVRSGYDPCPQKCCKPGWTRGCACTSRCPCVERHPR